jgi:hypothetical protein
MAPFISELAAADLGWSWPTCRTFCRIWIPSLTICDRPL